MALRPLLLLPLAGLIACGEDPEVTDPSVPVRVSIVAVDEHNLPVVVLEEDGGPRWLPIWIGTAEARSIASEMEKEHSPRPNTHDLAQRIIQDLEGELLRVVVTELRGGTYFARLVLRSGGETFDVDARPSDAIAIALRARAPIFVRASLLDAERPRAAGDQPEQRI